MTFAVALSDVAIVATETRVSMVGRDDHGKWRFEPASDTEPLTFKMGSAHVVLPARQRGMQPLKDGSGWCVVSCYLPVGRLCLQELAAAEPSDADGQMRAVRGPLDMHLRHRPSTVGAPTPLVECLIARREGQAFGVHRLSPESGIHDHHGIAYNIPPEFWLPDYNPGGDLNTTPAERLEIFQCMRGVFEPELVAAVGLGARIRAIARFFYVIWLLCGKTGSVNDRLELGVVDANGDLLALPPTPCGNLLSSTDATIEGLLEAPLPVPRDRLPDGEDWAAWFRDGSVCFSTAAEGGTIQPAGQPAP